MTKTLKLLGFFLATILLTGTVLYSARYSFYRALGRWMVAEEQVQNADAIVVISGGGTERIARGVELYQAGYAPLLILSGAAAEGGFSNAAAMASFARSHGVAAEAIVLEESSKDTVENAKEVRKIVQERNRKRIILVTSTYHQRRALTTFRRVFRGSTQIISAPANVDWYQPELWWDTPREREILKSELTKLLVFYLLRIS